MSLRISDVKLAGVCAETLYLAPHSSDQSSVPRGRVTQFQPSSKFFVPHGQRIGPKRVMSLGRGCRTEVDRSTTGATNRQRAGLVKGLPNFGNLG